MYWNLSSADASVAEVEVVMTRLSDGWHGGLIGDDTGFTGETVTEVRVALAKKVWADVRAWTDEAGVFEEAAEDVIKRIRLFAHTITDHERGGDHSGEVVEVAAIADRPGDWYARTLHAHLTLSPEEQQRRSALDALTGKKSAIQARGESFTEAQNALAALIMQELDLRGDERYPDWSGMRLTVTSRKTLTIGQLA